MSAASRRLAIALFVVALGCPGGDDGGMETDFFSADYAATYTEVRNCRGSGDHDLNNIRILADPDALGPYENRMDPFPVGAVVLKEEYDFGDAACEGEILQWTVMQSLGDGSSPDTLDWAWQRVDPDRIVVEEDPPRCIACHTGCGVPPDGYAGTCAIP